jgi:hypothetical protein
MELIQWLIILCLAGWIAWLHRGRQEIKSLSWLKDLQSDDLVTRSDLDQYHLRVIQMSQAQRDHLNTRLDEITRIQDLTGSNARIPPPNLSESLNFPYPSLPVVEVNEDPPYVGIETGAGSYESLSANKVTAATLGGLTEEIKGVGSGESCHQTPIVTPLLDTPSRTISLFQAGKSIDQIAQEMRIGRQEVQLLIRMAQNQQPAYLSSRDHPPTSSSVSRSPASTREG